MPKQLTVLIENQPGALAELTQALADAGVNITSIMLEGSLDFGVARVHVDNFQKGKKALQKEGFQVQTGDVISLPLENEPGALADVCEKLSKGQVNIESIFGTTAHAEKPNVILKVDDRERAADILGVD